MKKLILAVLLATQFGACALEPAPYCKLGIEMQVDAWSDWMLQPERSWMGDSPYASLDCGLELKRNYNLSLTSSTSLFTGAPFKEKQAAIRDEETGEILVPRNAEAELHWVRIGIWKKWGGR